MPSPCLLIPLRESREGPALSGGGVWGEETPNLIIIPLSLAKGERDTEPVLSLPKEGRGFDKYFKMVRPPESAAHVAP